MAREAKKRGRRRRGEAIAAIKTQMLRCSDQGRRRFKRGYLASGCGGDRGDAADAAIFYLACLAVCTAARAAALGSSIASAVMR